jgi:hypothetical protein
MGNYAETIGVKNTNKTLVTNNTILSAANSSLVEANNTNLKVLNNFIGTSWS